MDVANHFMPLKAQNIFQRLADDGGTQMPDVHRFGGIWTAVIDDDLAWMVCRPMPAPRVGNEIVCTRRECGVGHDKIDESGPGDLYGCEVCEVDSGSQIGHNLPGDLTRVSARLTRRRHSPVALKIRNLRLRRHADLAKLRTEPAALESRSCNKLDPLEQRKVRLFRTLHKEYGPGSFCEVVGARS